MITSATPALSNITVSIIVMVIGLIVNLVVIAIAWGKSSEKTRTLFSEVTALKSSKKILYEKNEALKDKINDNALETERRHTGISESIHAMQTSIIDSMSKMLESHRTAVKEEIKDLGDKIHSVTLSNGKQ